MKTIPSGAFKQCFSLKKVVLPSSIETIGNNAFDSDVNLDIDFTKLTNLTSIGSQAFSIINANGGNSAEGKNSVHDLQRRAVLCPRGDQGRAELPAHDRLPRRSVVFAHRQRAQAQSRRAPHDVFEGLCRAERMLAL